MFRWGLLFWLDWLLMILMFFIKKIFSCIRNFIITVMIFAGIVICTMSSLTGLDITDLFMFIWDFVGLIIDLVKKIL